MKTITVELSVEGCNKAIKELKEYQKKLKPKRMSGFVRRAGAKKRFRAMSIFRWCQLMSPDIMLAGMQRQTI